MVLQKLLDDTCSYLARRYLGIDDSELFSHALCTGPYGVTAMNAFYFYYSEQYSFTNDKLLFPAEQSGRDLLLSTVNL